MTRDPELRFTNTGQANVTFGLAVNRRWQNRQTQEWEEATSFFDVVCWREMAENVSETITRGARVMVAGRLEQRSWETQEGDRRSKVEVVADEIGPSLRWATAQITKNERRGPGSTTGAAAAGGGAGRPPRRHNPSPRRVPARATDSTRSPSDGTQQPARRDDVTARPQGSRPPGQEEALRALPGQGRVGRLQGRPHAAQVHERPRQDPLAPGDGQLRPAPAGPGHGDQDGARARAPALHPAHRDGAPGWARRA